MRRRLLHFGALSVIAFSTVQLQSQVTARTECDTPPFTQQCWYEDPFDHVMHLCCVPADSCCVWSETSGCEILMC